MTTLEQQEKTLEDRKNEMIKMFTKSAVNNTNESTHPHLSTTEIKYYRKLEVEVLANQFNFVLEQQQLVTKIKNQ